MTTHVFRRAAALFFLLLPLLAASFPAGAAEKNEDGLPLPRFAVIRSNPVNVRVGPGQKYDLAWIYTRSDIPVEIIAEFDIWRKIRDADGTEGWVQQNLLNGATRVGLVAPWKQGADFPLQDSATDDSLVRAYLTAGIKLDIRHCDGTWCEVNATGTDPQGHPDTISGYLHQPDIWGVYQNETF